MSKVDQDQKQDIVELAVEFKRETDRAYLVNNGEKDIWIPRSLIVSKEDDGAGYLTLFVKQWFAKKEGLI